MRSTKRWAACSLLILQALSTPIAHAQIAVAKAQTADGDSNYERANALFREGRRLMADGRYQEACEHFEQSLTFEDAIGTQFNLAACWESLGKTASAQALFAKVADRTQSLGQTDRAKVARERVAALEPRLSRLLIDVESAIPGLRIHRNGDSVDSKDWGATLAVDPGSYEIRATAPGKVPWSRHIFVSARRALVWVSIPRLADEPHSGRGLAPEDTSVQPPRDARSGEHGARRPNTEQLRTWRPVAFGLGVLGLGGLAAGSVFALKYRSSNDDAKSICTGTPACPREDIDRYDRLTRAARAARNGAYVSFGLGAAALAGATLAYFAVPLYRSEATRVSARPAYGIDGAWAITAEGQF